MKKRKMTVWFDALIKMVFLSSLYDDSANQNDDRMKNDEEETSLLTTEAYARWLDQFTLKHMFFFSNGTYLNKDNLEEEDYINVHYIKSFFYELLEYAEDINYNVKEDDYVMKMIFKFRQSFYEIGGSHAVGYYIERLNDDKEEYLDLEVAINKKSSKSSLTPVRKRYI